MNSLNAVSPAETDHAGHGPDEPCNCLDVGAAPAASPAPMRVDRPAVRAAAAMFILAALSSFATFLVSEGANLGAAGSATFDLVCAAMLLMGHERALKLAWARIGLLGGGAAVVALFSSVWLGLLCGLYLAGVALLLFRSPGTARVASGTVLASVAMALLTAFNLKIQSLSPAEQRALLAAGSPLVVRGWKHDYLLTVPERKHWRLLPIDETVRRYPRVDRMIVDDSRAAAVMVQVSDAGAFVEGGYDAAQASLLEAPLAKGLTLVSSRDVEQEVGLVRRYELTGRHGRSLHALYLHRGRLYQLAATSTAPTEALLKELDRILGSFVLADP